MFRLSCRFAFLSTFHFSKFNGFQ